MMITTLVCFHGNRMLDDMEDWVEVNHQRVSGYRLTSQTPVNHKSVRILSVYTNQEPSEPCLKKVTIPFPESPGL